MPEYRTYESIAAAIARFNQRAYNAGLDFKTYTSDKSCLYIQASFDFAYYVNVDIECHEVAYTNIHDNGSWQDAWNADQLFLLSAEELEDIVDFKEVVLLPDKQYFGIVFNINGRENYYTSGMVICSSLYIHWRYPEYQD